MENLVKIYRSWLDCEDEMEQDCLWEDFVAAGKDLYGEEGFNSHIAFFVQFGNAEFHDWVVDEKGKIRQF